MHEHNENEHHHHHDLPAVRDKAQVAALLSYMYEHNVSHEDELRKLSASMSDLDFADEAGKVAEAGEFLARGNALIKEALEQLKD